MTPQADPNDPAAYKDEAALLQPEQHKDGGRRVGDAILFGDRHRVERRMAPEQKDGRPLVHEGVPVYHWVAFELRAVKHDQQGGVPSDPQAKHGVHPVITDKDSPAVTIDKEVWVPIGSGSEAEMRKIAAHKAGR